MRRWLRPVVRWWIDWRRPPTLGQRGERAAAKFLRSLGYKIVFQAGRASQGELDLVAVDGRTIVFVEVKTRRSLDAGHPAEAVDDIKQRRLTYLGVAYLKRHGLLEHRARFDVISIIWPEGQRHPTIQHFPNAFEATGAGQMFS